MFRASDAAPQGKSSRAPDRDLGREYLLRAVSWRCAATVRRQDSSTSAANLLCPLDVDSSRPVREHVLALNDLGPLSFTVNEVDLHAFLRMKRTPAA